MKLKTFNKVSIETRTKFTVRDEKGNYVDDFTVDYTEGFTAGLNKALGKRFDLEERGAEVQYVSTYFNKIVMKPELHVDVIIKEG